MSHNNLTPTVVLRHLNRMMGALVQQIELSEEEMMRVVFQESLPTYSKYFPYKYKISLKHYNSISPEYPNVYRIPNEDDLTIFVREKENSFKKFQEKFWNNPDIWLN